VAGRQPPSPPRLDVIREIFENIRGKPENEDLLLEITLTL